MDLKQTEIQSLLKIHSKFKPSSPCLPWCCGDVENDSEADVEDELDPPKQLWIIVNWWHKCSEKSEGKERIMVSKVDSEHFVLLTFYAI